MSEKVHVMKRVGDRDCAWHKRHMGEMDIGKSVNVPGEFGFLVHLEDCVVFRLLSFAEAVVFRLS
jgi:hypothetical protein